MVEQVLGKLKEFTLPKTVTINVTQEELYTSSDEVTGSFNALARRLADLEKREKALKAEYEKAKAVIVVLTQYATDRGADARNVMEQRAQAEEQQAAAAAAKEALVPKPNR